METDFVEDFKQKLIERLNIKHIDPKDIDIDAPIFGDGLGLDSIDALEIIVMLDDEYNIKFNNPDEAKHVFTSIRNIANYIETQQK
ncbi:MAG TPA: phosphopantetheine-binding protein [Saprospiraceae bacterium]|nr:phosphopantetheine-binding protein [Saprospiraceae bacterium]HQW55325.1 phosphopantetheine-binding protein [Saprospiraceae bacterium]